MKINVIKTPVARKIISTAMLAAATLGVTNVMAKPSNPQEAKLTQTEVMSKSAAQGVQIYSTQGPTYSNQRNIKLDEKYIELGKSSGYVFNEEEERADLTACYKECGTFGTTFVLQNEINLKALHKMTNSMVSSANQWSTEKGEEVFELCNNLKDWYLEQYEPYIYGMTAKLTAKNSSAEDYSKALDNIIDENFSDVNRQSYYKLVAEYKAKQSGDRVMKASDLVAFKTYLMSYMFLYLKMNDLGFEKAWGVGDIDDVFAKIAKP